MKTINIAAKSPQKKTLEFVLGNGQRKTFTSQRDANAFRAQTNRYLTRCLVILNETYIDLFREYRLMWFISANTSGGTHTNYLSIQYSIRASLSGAESVFDKFNATWGGSNDPFFAFIDLRKIAVFLQDAGDKMTAFHKKRNATANYYHCSILTDRCLLVVQRLQEYGE